MTTNWIASDEELVAELRAGTLDARVALVHRGDLDAGVHAAGAFGGFLFFSGQGMAAASGMGTRADAAAYFVAGGQFAVAEPQRWPWDASAHEAVLARVPEAMDALGIDDEDAAYEALCDGDYDESAMDDAWALQRLTCEIARELGYAVVELQDEHGTSYAVDALNPDVAIFDARGNRIAVQR